MSANIAFSAPNFSAVGTDTRITTTIGGRRYALDSLADAANLPVTYSYPSRYVKLRPAGNGWITGLGELASAGYILDVLSAAKADTLPNAREVLKRNDGWQAAVLNIHQRTVEQLESTEIFGAPFASVEHGNWRLGLRENDSRTDDSLLTTINWGCPSPPVGSQALSTRLNTLRGSPRPHSVASAMAQVILLAGSTDASVGPNMQFGFTALNADRTLQRGFFDGRAEDILRMTEEDFVSSLRQPH